MVTSTKGTRCWSMILKYPRSDADQRKFFAAIHFPLILSLIRFCVLSPLSPPALLCAFCQIFATAGSLRRQRRRIKEYLERTRFHFQAPYLFAIKNLKIKGEDRRMLNDITFAKINKITLKNGVVCIWRQCSAGKINRLGNGNSDYRKSNEVLSWILLSSLAVKLASLTPFYSTLQINRMRHARCVSLS